MCSRAFPTHTFSMKKARDTEFYLFFGNTDRVNRLHCAFRTSDRRKIARKMRVSLPAFNESAINLAREMMSVKQKLHAKWGNKIFIFPSSSGSVCKKESADKFNDLFFMATCMPFQDEWIEKRRQQALLAFIFMVASSPPCAGSPPWIKNQWSMREKDSTSLLCVRVRIFITTASRCP